jgi:hypothetical protein
MAISTNQPEAFAQILEQLRGPKGAGSKLTTDG